MMRKMAEWYDYLMNGLMYLWKAIKLTLVIVLVFVGVLSATVSFAEYVKLQSRPPQDADAFLREAAEKSLGKKENTFLGYDFSQPLKGNREMFYGDMYGKKEQISFEKMKEELDQAIDYLSLNEMAESIEKDPLYINIMRNLLTEAWKRGSQWIDEIIAFINQQGR